MLRGISWLSWLICILSVVGAVVLAWGLDPKSASGLARIVGSVIAIVVAFLALVNGSMSGRRISAIERGRYPRLRAGAVRRIANRLSHHDAQTVTIAGEGGDDIREIVAVLIEALKAANWDVREATLGASFFNGGRGILVCHTEAAKPAATALIEVLKSEGLSATYAGDSPTGYPVYIAFRRP
jgi:hypothetical protein